jgi:multiple antibiotic resistance protein
VLRVAGGIIVAAAGWKLLSEGSQKELEASADGVSRMDPLDQAFYPLTLPLTTGPGTIAVVISLGPSYTNSTDEIFFVLANLLAVVVIAITIFLCFAYADRIRAYSAPEARTSPCGCPRLFCFDSASRFYGQAEASF